MGVFVVVDDCDTSTTVGKDHWLVYRNTGSGFAASPTSWALPTVAGGVFNWGLATYDMCPTYSTFDIDGDGKADLVIPDDCDASSTVGKDHWLVYRSTGSGFAASPINWSMSRNLMISCSRWLYFSAASTKTLQSCCAPGVSHASE